MHTLNIKPDKISPTFLSRLLFSNITNLTTASVLLTEQNLSDIKPQALLEAIKNTKRLSETDKSEIIKDSGFTSVAKLQKRYERGYGGK